MKNNRTVDIPNDSISVLSTLTKSDMMSVISNYHEELAQQNEELRSMNDSLQNILKKYETLFDALPTIVLFLDENLTVIEANRFSREEMQISIGSSIQSLVAMEDQDTLYFHFEKIRRSMKTDFCQIELSVAGNPMIVKLFTSPVMLDTQQFFLCNFVDITYEKNHEEEVKYVSTHDSLTGLYNRYFFSEELSRLDTERNYPLGIIMADVNGLKFINDTFGHLEGDKFLIQAARMIQHQARKDEILARIGGDEFACIIPKISESDLQLLLGRFETACNTIDIRNINLSVAFGAAQKTRSDQDINDVLKLAEDRMYQKKMIMTCNNQKKILGAILTMLHEKYPREEAHSARVAKFMKAFCKLQLKGTADENLYEMAGLLHDIGKIAINYSLLDLNRPLELSEKNEINKHPEIGYRILKSTDRFAEIKDIVLYHHEHYDGSGYPQHLHGQQIPYASRVLAVCDAYEAMTSDRPYRKAMDRDTAILEMKHSAGTYFDPMVVEQFIQLVRTVNY